MASGSGPSSVCETVKPAAARARRSARFSSRRAAIASPAFAKAQKTEREPLGDVGALPPARERRQIVRRDAGDRSRRIGRRRHELHALALEPQHPHAGDLGARQPIAETFRNGAEVFANHHALRAFAFERDMADEIVERIGEIGAVRRTRAIGNKEQTLQAHRVIDAQHAGVAHVGAVDSAERGPALARAGQRIGRRQAPVLPLDGEWIGRRADRDAMRKRACMRPGFGAVRRGADRKIAVEADLQAVVPRALGGSPKLAVGEPLAEKGELEALAVAFDRMVDRLWVAVAQILRPESANSAPASPSAAAWKAAKRRNVSPPDLAKAW